MKKWGRILKHFTLNNFSIEIIVHCLIVIVSFCTYSYLFYPALNSDHAVSILMGNSFHLPNDWYFWGQDRMGSLIPMLAWPLINIFGCNAVVSESIVHYSILVAGFLTFSTFFKTPVYRIALAVLWFLPPFRMADLMLLSFGIQYSIIAILCYLAYKIYKFEGIIRLREISKWYVPFGIVSIIGVWVSDLVAISAIIMVVLLIYYTIKFNKINLKSHLKGWLTLLGFALACYLFISYIKSGSLHHNYSEIAPLHIIESNISILFETIIQIFTFQANEPFTSAYSWLVLLLLTILVFLSRKSDIKITFVQWFLIIDALFILAAILVTKWTNDNHVPRRYFTCTYVSFGISILLYVEACEFKLKSKFNGLLIIVLLTGGLGSIYNLKYIWPATLKPRFEEISELKQLGNVGIIGDYWNSYICSIGAPDAIISTPHEASEVRNPKLVEKVFLQPTIYLVKDWWLESFPDSITQFGRKLKASGNEFECGGLTLKKYEIEKF